MIIERITYHPKRENGNKFIITEIKVFGLKVYVQKLPVIGPYDLSEGELMPEIR